MPYRSGLRSMILSDVLRSDGLCSDALSEELSEDDENKLS